MSSRARNREGPSFSLFSFLDILVCVMGSLIVILAAIAQHVPPRSQQQLEEDAEKLAAMESERSELEWRAKHLRASCDKTAEQLASERLELSHLEEHSRRLRDELAALEATAKSTETDSGGQAQRLHDDIASVEKKIAAALVNLDKAKELAAKNKQVGYAILPYEGPNETRRRPLYIECRGDAIVLQPEGIALSEDDFYGPSNPGNPLAAALRAQREYLARNQRTNLREPGEPYPLLLVRPDGIGAYYVARLAMASWGAEFGYELIDADWKLEFKQPDAKLTEITRAAVEEAREKQRSLILSAPRLYARGERAEFRATAPGEGDHPGYGPPGRGPGRGMSGRAWGGRGGGAGDGYRDGSSFAGGRSGRGGRGAESGGLGPDNPYRALAEAGGAGSGATGAGGEGLMPGAGASPLAGTDGAGGATGQGSSSAGGVGSDGPAFPGAEQARGAGGAQGGTQSGRGTGESPDSIAARGQAGNGATAAAGASAGQGSSGAMGVSGGSGGPPGSSSGKPSPQRGSATQGAGNVPTATRSLAKARGINWGLPDAARSAVPITRPVRIECRTDKLVVHGDGRPGYKPQEIALTTRTEESVDELVSSVWEQIEGWGAAGRGMYWRPVLSIDVMPGAEGRFQDLQLLLADSGLDVRQHGRAPASRLRTVRHEN